jgi:Na+/H+ antiporter NhaD/arsenite permease-like protein
MQNGYYYKLKMSLQSNTIFSYFIYFIILVKCLFVFFAVWNFYLKKKNPSNGNKKNTQLEKKISYYKNLTENIFIVLVSILLIYLFNPYHHHKHLDNKYVRTLFFIYGILTLVTFDWEWFYDSIKKGWNI